MRTRLFALWEQIISGLWFVPTVLVVGHGVLAIGLIVTDQAVDIGAGDRVTWIFRGGSAPSPTRCWCCVRCGVPRTDASSCRSVPLLLSIPR